LLIERKNVMKLVSAVGIGVRMTHNWRDRIRAASIVSEPDEGTERTTDGESLHVDTKKLGWEDAQPPFDNHLRVDFDDTKLSRRPWRPTPRWACASSA
jgi:hypothetical protein